MTLLYSFLADVSLGVCVCVCMFCVGTHVCDRVTCKESQFTSLFLSDYMSFSVSLAYCTG